MAKPIFIIGFRQINDESFEKYMDIIQRGLEERFPDYHILVYSHSKEETEFQAFYEKDFNEVKFEELKEIVRNNMNNNKQEIKDENV